jgi:hypothetical protein
VAGLWDRFGVDASILDAEVSIELRKNKNDIPDGKAIICSLQGVAPKYGMMIQKRCG